MGPTRTNPIAHSARDKDVPKKRPSSSPESETEDNSVRGLRYKVHYSTPEASQNLKGVRDPENPRPPPLRLYDLQCIKTLGQGEYGQVLLVRSHRELHPLDRPGCLFAMKVLRKKIIRYQDEYEPHKKDVERGVLADLPWNPFVNGIIQTFHDSRNLYLMLELIPCGTLHSLIQKRAPFDPAATAFYFANIVCALDFLENHDIIHRDIKPDNILVGPDGYLCLADFGSAARGSEEDDWLMVGTPLYMAPELFSPEAQSERVFTGVDWWSSGCVLYQMATKKIPFHGQNQASTFKKVLSGKIVWPPTVRVGRILKSLVAGLLTVNAAQRLGTQGVSNVMDHPWLKDVNWDKLRARQYLAPYIPPAPHLTETWHRHPLPEQRKVPGLEIAIPPLQLAYDDRFPDKPTI